MVGNNIYATKIEYDKLSDEELVKLFKEQDKNAQECLMNRYENLVKIKVISGNFIINGAERDDIMQEARIGLYQAIKGYKLDENSSFKTFANICITRRLIDTIKTANRQKNIALNTSLSLSSSAYEDNNSLTLEEMYDVANDDDPLDIILKKEKYNDVKKLINETSSQIQKQIFPLYEEGKSYKEIASELGISVKKVDNAIQRMKKNLMKNMQE